MDRKTIYFDNAASTPLPEEVMDAMMACMHACHGNPSSIHHEGRKARMMLETARRTIAGLLDTKPAEIIFTSGGTEANNAVLVSCQRDLGKTVFITSRLEHPAVLRTFDLMQKFSKVKVLFADNDLHGHIHLDHLEDLLRLYPGSVVSLMHANNETGTLLPVKDVAMLCRRYDALFHSDTVQTIGKYLISLSSGHFDFAVGSAHKFHGPKGVGFMYVKDARNMLPFITGGKQERSLRAGTENLCGIVGMAKALEWSNRSIEETKSHVAELKTYLKKGLYQLFPDAIINGDADGRAAYFIINFSLPLRLETPIILSRLDMEGICVSSGSACSSGSISASHVLEAMGADTSLPSLRVSFSRFNTLDEIDMFLDVLSRFRQMPGEQAM